LEPELAHWADLVEALRWAGFLLDREHRLVWASSDLQRFLGSPPQEDLGYGMHVVEAFGLDVWRQIATSETRSRLMSDLAPALTSDVPFTKSFRSSFDYLEPGGESELPVMRVNLLVTPLHDDTGAFCGTFALGFISVRPGLVSLLARGDEEMYERMAKLVDPSSRQGAILFCDLEGSTELARTLPSSGYFRLIRSLWTEIDAVVARHEGIIGKHAGDGASAYFLLDDLGSASRAATAAIRTAREIHERSEAIFGDALESSCLMRIGIHWGSSLYIGQLVPGGRLDVTALGDAVNECARIEESAAPDQTIASKELIERLSDEDAAELGLAPEKFRYVPLRDLPGAGEKARAVAGAISVIPIEGE
jgi:class 3 adenylate cyclase